MPGPLDGIKVVEVANWLAAPSTAALMADMGADVVKVEPPGGDPFRQLLPTVIPDAPINWVYELDNRGKRSVTVDLEQPAGADVVHHLLRSADIFISNLTGPRLARYRLRPADVHATKPDCVYASLSGFGTTGPDAGRQGFDHTAFWARSGIMSLLGEEGTPAVMGRGGQGDHPSGLNLLAATLAALRLRDQTGEGQVVEVTLQRTGVWTIGFDISGTLITGEQPARANRTLPANPMATYYQTRDGRWLILMMPTPDPYWAPFCRAMGEPGWENDERFNDLQKRRENTVLAKAVAEIFRAHDLDYWREQLDAHGLIWAPTALLPEVVQDPQLRQLHAFDTVEHPTYGPFETVAAPFSIRGAEIRARGSAPEPGQHTFEVLAAHGVDADQIGEWAAQGLFG